MHGVRTVAQLVEHDTFNVGVAGPIPASPTTIAVKLYGSLKSGESLLRRDNRNVIISG